MKKILCLAVIAALLTSCGTSVHLVESWRAPEVTVDMQKLNKVLVVAILKTETNRHATEDQLVAMLKGKGVASYNYLTKELLEEKESEIKERLSNEGFDAVIIMRLADVDKDVNYIRGNYNSFPTFYNRFWPYYWNTRNNFYQPGHYVTTKKYTVETNVYSLIRDKLIWSGLTSSVDPKNVERLMHEVAKEVYKKMKTDGFIVNELP